MNKKSIIEEGEVTIARLETLTDGIFSIAMTLLVLDIHVPDLINSISSSELSHQLILMWPRILSFLISFIILGMFWVSHHTEFRFIKKLDNKLIWLNIFFLLFVSLLPFSAALLGRYAFNQTAIFVYGIQLIFLVLMQYFIWVHARRKPELMEDSLHPRMGHLVNRLAFLAIMAYIMGMALCFIKSPYYLNYLRPHSFALYFWLGI